MIRVLYRSDSGLCCGCAEFLQFCPAGRDGALFDHLWFIVEGYLIEIAIDDHSLFEAMSSALVRGFVDLSDWRLISEVDVHA